MEAGGEVPVIDGFELYDEVGSGGFSVVRLARHTETGTYAAVKVVDILKLNGAEFNGVMREISVFMQVSHPNIVSLYRLSYINNLLYFFMEYGTKGTLLAYVNAHNGLDERESNRIFQQLFSAVRYCHMQHFLVHRDLKLENVLLDTQMNVKLADFGFAGTFYCNILRTIAGTGGYTPPEILAGNEYDEKCDVWSLGVCLYAMLTGHFPFTPITNDFRVLTKQVNDLEYPKTFSPYVIDLLRKMFTISPGARPNMTQLQNHPWLRGIPKLPIDLTPTPIVFYKVSNPAQIMRFRRAPVTPDPTILSKMESMGFDIEQTKAALASGLHSRESTTYFALKMPLLEKPEIPKKLLQPIIVTSPSNSRKSPKKTSTYSSIGRFRVVMKPDIKRTLRVPRPRLPTV